MRRVCRILMQFSSSRSHRRSNAGQSAFTLLLQWCWCHYTSPNCSHTSINAQSTRAIVFRETSISAADVSSLLFVAHPEALRSRQKVVIKAVIMLLRNGKIRFCFCGTWIFGNQMEMLGTQRVITSVRRESCIWKQLSCHPVCVRTRRPAASPQTSYYHRNEAFHRQHDKEREINQYNRWSFDCSLSLWKRESPTVGKRLNEYFIISSIKSDSMKNAWTFAFESHQYSRRRRALQVSQRFGGSLKTWFVYFIVAHW